MPSRLDEVDVKILTSLLRDTRITNTELSGKACITIKTLVNRVNKLIDAGYIKGYAVELDLNKVGKKLSAFTAVTLKRTSIENINMFRERMKSVPEVIECYHVNGLCDFILRIVVSDMEEYSACLKTKLSISEIDTIKTDFILHEDRSVMDLSNLSKKWTSTQTL